MWFSLLSCGRTSGQELTVMDHCCTCSTSVGSFQQGAVSAAPFIFYLFILKIFIWPCLCVHTQSLSLVRLCNTMDCSPSGSSVHEISQARIPECVAISFSSGSSWPRDWPLISCISRQITYHCATWEVPKIVDQIVLFFHLHINNKTYREHQSWYW